MGSNISVIAKPYAEPFVRLWFKRRDGSTGEYESDWQTVPAKYIKKVGQVGYGIDDIKLNFYQYSPFRFTLDNSDGFFSKTDDEKSFFYNYLTRYRTLVKVDAGYIDDDGTEYPTTPTLFVGMLSDKIKYKEDNLLNWNAWHISRIFQEFPAANITGLGVTQTASDIITNIKDYVDVSSTAIFQKYITSGGWNIDATTDNYNLATTSSLEGLSCWELMKKLAEAEDKLLYIDRIGDFYFTERSQTSADPVYHFSGVGDTDNTYGKNIIKGGVLVDPNFKQVYNRVRVEYDTTSSFYIKQETYDWGAVSQSSFLYGVRTYDYQNEWMGVTVATNIGDRIYDNYHMPKKLVFIRAKFVPHLDINDNVSVTYITQYYTGEALWGFATWGQFLWGEKSGKNINIDNESFVVEDIKHNLSNFTSNVRLKEV